MASSPTTQQDNIKVKKDGSRAELVFEGELTVYTASDYEAELMGESLAGVTDLSLDFTKLTDYDSYFVVMLEHIEELCAKNNIRLKVQGMDEDMQRLRETLEQNVKDKIKKKRPQPPITKFVTNVGTASMAMWADFRAFVEFLGEFVINLVAIFTHPASIRWADFPFNFLRAGVNAVPIVVVIGLLDGFIIAYQSAVQLEAFGATAFLGKLVSRSVTRELAPLITAIIVAGRSGSAFAAEIGTMNVSEEVDALRSMGFNVMRFLVMPRVLAVVAAMPFLIIIADLMGVIGGYFAATIALDMTLAGYIRDTREALIYSDVIGGIVKGVVFGILVAMVGCFRGLQVSGGAESVGRYTTSAVVTGIFLIVLADAVLSIVFQSIGIHL